ncbi:aspartate ammonia-lyase [Alicyclobacillus sp. SO9]|uniref:aspartate ammonia-lyase n=1 Tax=Alicyclobacillus sp. SO9 TaxID=2665646 RepID=UPI0018E7475C|nr:aspartate ammonia-lyase [Alicyclobacillus sp. SO9]QQE79113.1 aspartate ammonia-lyase [Alicyclobacillus sp. SO9]
MDFGEASYPHGRGSNGNNAGNTSTRIERDFLGSKQLPQEAYYGIQTMRAVENFPITGYRLHPILIQSMAIVKRCAALANMELGLLERRIGNVIVQAADEVIGGQWHHHFLVDPIQGGAGTSINMNTNEVLANRSIELLGGQKGDYTIISPNTHVNMSESTNDSFPTATHIALLTLLQKLLSALTSLRDAFYKKAEAFDGVIKLGRTHLQDAVPIRLGQELKAYAEVLNRDILRIRATQSNLYTINMGATAVGTGLNADLRYIRRVSQLLAENTGFPLTSARDMVDATQNTDAYTELSSALKVCAVSLSKIANDLRLLASGPRAGFAEIRLPERQPGSSIMPGKVNPVICEVVNQVAFQVIGNDATVTHAAGAGQLELNVMEPVLVFNLIESINIMTQAATVFRSYAIEGMEANEARCKEYVDNSVGIITALNPHIGYETASRLAHEAIATGESVRDLCLRDGILSEEQLNQILDVFAMTHPGIAGASGDASPDAGGRPV